MGIPVESPAFHKHREEIVTKVREAKQRQNEALAQTMGLDLKVTVRNPVGPVPARLSSLRCWSQDPVIQRELARLEREALTGGSEGPARPKLSVWRRATGFLQRHIYSFLYLAYVAIALHLAAAVYHTLTVQEDASELEFGPEL